MTEFTPVSALLGGALIGLAAASLMALHGRIAGISGILGGALTEGRGWRWAFLIGLALGAVVTNRVMTFPEPTISDSASLLVGAGLLVGVGTQLGSGCTSGHGVCGLARLSVRSLVATATFMLVAGLMVYATRHLGG